MILSFTTISCWPNWILVGFTWSPRCNLALEHRLQRLECPTLVVKAEDDRLVPGDMADRFAEMIPGAKTVTILETGHALCIERPHETAAAIVKFIEENC